MYHILVLHSMNVKNVSVLMKAWNARRESKRPLSRLHSLYLSVSELTNFNKIK